MSAAKVAHTPTPWVPDAETIIRKLVHQLKKTRHALAMRKNRTEFEDEAIRTATKAIAKAEGGL